MRDHLTKKQLAGAVCLSALISLIPFLAVFAAGIVPCGGPGQAECNICWFFVLMREVIDFVIFKVSTAMAAVALAIAGALFLASGSDPGRYQTGKLILTNAFKGYLVMLAGWLFINTFFMAFGVSEWTGLKEGWWKVKASCAMQKDTELSCGDGLVTGDEQCDPKEKIAACQARTGNTTAGCQDILSRCIADTCKLKPEVIEPDDDDNDDNDDSDACTDANNEIGQGCYLDENGNGKIDDNECKKGKYVCDAATKKLKCEGDGKIIDYCCSDDLSEFADGKIGDKPFTIVRATVDDIHMTGGAKLQQVWAGLLDLDNNPFGGIPGGFNCDEVCKKTGKVCVGIGLTDPSKNACVYEVHDEMGRSAEPAECVPGQAGGMIISAQLSQNQAKNNCKAYFGFLYYSKRGERWSTAYDKYENFCNHFDPYSAWKVPGPIDDPGFDTLAPPDKSCGKCKPKAASGETCTGRTYKQDPSDSCAFHGNDLGETACYCY
jgi:hypothetical protein